PHRRSAPHGAKNAHPNAAQARPSGPRRLPGPGWWCQQLTNSDEHHGANGHYALPRKRTPADSEHAHRITQSSSAGLGPRRARVRDVEKFVVSMVDGRETDRKAMRRKND